MRYKLHAPGTRGKYWYLRGTHAGQRFEVSTGQASRQAAEAWAVEYLARLARDPVPPAAGPVGFSRACDAYIDFRNPRRDDRAWLLRICRRLGDRPCAEITHAELVALALDMLPDASPAHRNRSILGPAARVLHYAHEQAGWNVPWRRVKLFKVSRRSPRRPAPDADLAALLDRAEGHRWLLLAMLYETGLRIGDLLALDEQRLDLPAGRILARIAKTDALASVPVSPELVAALANAPRCRVGGRQGMVFPWPNRWAVYRWLRPLCRELGIAYTPHLSRHALATDLLRRGIPDKQAAEYGAWADPRSLQRYQFVDIKPLADRSVARMIGGAAAFPHKKAK